MTSPRIGRGPRYWYSRLATDRMIKKTKDYLSSRSFLPLLRGDVLSRPDEAFARFRAGSIPRRVNCSAETCLFEWNLTEYKLVGRHGGRRSKSNSGRPQGAAVYNKLISHTIPFFHKTASFFAGLVRLVKHDFSHQGPCVYREKFGSH